MGQYYFKMLSEKIRKTEGNAVYKYRAKWIPTTEGYKLSLVEGSERARFVPDGWERAEDKASKHEERAGDFTAEDRERAYRRASIRCMDLVMSNPMDWFCTLTLDPAKIDRTSYKDVERAFSRWASNEVQRHDLRYIAVPEHHKDGESLHLHMLCSGGLKLSESGVKQDGKMVYNIDNWRWGFTNCKRITGEDASIACAKYCLKYMRKQQGQKIGGRYFLTGGSLRKPIYVYSDDKGELIGAEQPIWEKTISGDWGKYEKISFI